MKGIFLCLLSVVLIYSSHSVSLAEEVEEIIGGDLLRLESGEEVWLAGVDTEKIKNPRRLGKAFSQEALRYMATLAGDYKIRIEEADVELGKDGRRSVYVQLFKTKKRQPTEQGIVIAREEKLMLNTEVIRRGYGKPHRNYRGRYREVFKAAEKEAKKRRWGMWRL